MSLSPEFIAEARALAFYRKLKVRRARRYGAARCDNAGLPGWKKIGHGHFGEAWEHADYPGYVVKISGRAGFGDNRVYDEKPSLDGWPTFAQHCQAHPHPNLPKILHFERLSVGISFGIMPFYEEIDTSYGSDDCTIVSQWWGYLDGSPGAPAWMWPIIGMSDALCLSVDLHSGNVMRDMDTGECIMTTRSPSLTNTSAYSLASQGYGKRCCFFHKDHP